MDIVVLAICAVVCDAENWEAIELFGRTKLECLRRYVPLANGVLTHQSPRLLRLIEASHLPHNAYPARILVTPSLSVPRLSRAFALAARLRRYQLTLPTLDSARSAMARARVQPSRNPHC